MTFIDGAKITKRHKGAGWCAVTVHRDKSSAAAWTCSVREQSRRQTVPHRGTVEVEAPLSGWCQYSQRVARSLCDSWTYCSTKLCLNLCHTRHFCLRGIARSIKFTCLTKHRLANYSPTNCDALWRVVWYISQPTSNAAVIAWSGLSMLF